MKKTLTAAALTLVTACTPVLEPLAARQAVLIEAAPMRARVTWAIDTSGSMSAPLDPTHPDCPERCGADPGQPGCPAACPTARAVVREGLEAMAAALGQTADVAAVFFPRDLLCGAPLSFEVPYGSGLGMDEVFARFDRRSPAGGTPSAATLAFIAAQTPVDPTAQTFVVLVTDGQPNCNPQNPNGQCGAPNAQCRCTIASCDPGGALCALGCLDDLGTIAAAQGLAQAGMQLMVVGVGAEVSSAPAALSAIATGLPRTCATSADCGANGTCGEDGLCRARLFLASSEVDFDAPAQRLAGAVRRVERCGYVLAADVLPGGLTVSLGDAALEPSSWVLEGNRRVTLLGAACEQLLATPELAPAFTWSSGA